MQFGIQQGLEPIPLVQWGTTIFPTNLSTILLAAYPCLIIGSKFSALKIRKTLTFKSLHHLCKNLGFKGIL